MTKTVIIGAGLTGLSAAYHLEKQGFTQYKIFEKEATVGGLCRSVTQDGFTFDFTGHLLHISDPYFRSCIETVVGMDQLHTIQRQSFIYSHGTYTRYPFQTNLYGLPEKIITDCLIGFARRKKSLRGPKSFPQWVLHHFGPGIARHFFLPYQKKIFAYDLRKITASWTNRFVPATSLEQLIRGALSDKRDEKVGYNARFFYPKHGGIVSWVNALAAQLNNPIHTNFCVETIDMRTKTVHFTNGHVEPFDQLITTMPLNTLLECTRETASTSVKRARKHLVCNSVVNFNLGVNRPDLSDKHWIYFIEKQYPFYRIGFPHNFSPSLVPPNCSSLYGEFAHIGKSPRWVDNTLKKALHETKKVLNIADQDVATEKIIHIPHAYVIYDAWRDRNLKKLLARLQECNIYSVGRYGQWKYASMQEAVLDGKKIAQHLTVRPAKQLYPGAQPQAPVKQITPSKQEVTHE